MNKICLKRMTINNFFLYIVAFSLIYISGSAITSVDYGKDISIMLNIIIYLTGIILFIKSVALNNKLELKFIMFIIFSMIFGILWVTHYPVNAFGVIKRIALFILLFYVARYFKSKNIDFLMYLFNIVLFIASIALIFYMLINIFHVSLPYLIIQQNGDGQNVYNNYYFLFITGSNYLQRNIFGLNVYRLQSIFWEPGVYAVYLDFALFYELFISESHKKFNTIILFFSVILTHSTTGICIAIVMLGYSMMKRFKKLESKIVIFLPILIIVCLGVAYVWLQKKNMSDNAWSSYALRINDFYNSLEIWKNNFWLGTGFKNEALFDSTIPGRGNSNGLLYWCYTMGFVGLFSVLYPIITNIVKSDKNNRSKYIMYMIIFLAINMTEPLMNSYFMIYLVAYSYVLVIFREKRGNDACKQKNIVDCAQIFWV